jgi:hypothetical protein
MDVVPPEQNCCEDGVAVTVGAGFTVTVACIAVPGQVAAVGVIVYVAVPALDVVAVNVCAIVEPDAEEAPVTLDCVTVHEYVVPATLLVRAIEVALFEQMLCELGVAVADGVGLTVTVAVIAEPAQELAVGVMV